MNPDRSEFTFWPEPSESAFIATHSANDIGMIMHDYPDLFPQIVHELWRTDQVEKMFESITVLRKQYHVEPSKLFHEHGIEPIAAMCLMYGVPIDEASTFVKETLGVIYKVQHQLEFQTPLPTRIATIIDEGIDYFMAPIKEMNDKTIRH